MTEKKPSRRRSKATDKTLTSNEPVVKSMTLEKALETFLQYQDAVRHSKETLKDYRRVINLFLRHIQKTFEYVYIDQIEESDILQWLSHLRNTDNSYGRPYSSRSIETYSRDVSVFFHWLIQHGHISVNPMGKIEKPKVEKALIRVFTEEELVLLDAACDRAIKGKSLTSDERKAMAARDRAFLWLLLSTGIRISEACGLLFSDIDWDQGMIYVRGKGAKERKIPFGRVARQHLNTYIHYWRGETIEKEEPHVFLHAFGGALSRASANQIFVRLKKVAGITDKRVSAHTCRHWFAVNAIKNGMPSTVLQGLLGHAQLEMINVYVRLAEQDNRELYAKFSPVDSLKMHHSAKGRREQQREWRNARKKNNKVEGADS